MPRHCGPCGWKNWPKRLPGTLSGGQQQRVAFIRMLCQPADFMLLDEPMSHLDERNAAVMAGFFWKEVADVTGHGGHPSTSD